MASNTDPPASTPEWAVERKVVGSSPTDYFMPNVLRRVDDGSHLALLSIEDLRDPRSFRVISSVLEVIPSMVAIFDSDLRFVYANQAYVDVVDSPQPDWRGRPLEEYLPPYLVEHILPRMKRAAAGDHGVRFRIDLRAKDGLVRSLIASYQPVFAADGSLEFIIMTGTDITQLAAAEQRITEMQRYETISNLVGGLAHDFNNFLSAISGMSFMLRKAIDRGTDESDDPVEQIQQLEVIDRAIDRAASLTSQLLSYGCQQMLHPTSISVRSTLESIRDLLRTSLRDNIQLVFDFGTTTDAILVDRSQFEAALMNLVLNARDAMPHGGVLTIRTRHDEQGSSDPRSLDQADRPSHGLVIEVTDTGTGMTTEVAARAFDPFFTTKAQDAGSGMGLAMVHGFVRQSGGEIEVRSETGRGSSFRLSFPVSTAGVATPETTARRVSTVSRRLHVVLVEDDVDVALAIGGLIEALGHRYHHEIDVAGAMRYLDTAPQLPDTLLTDINLSGPESGLDLIADASARYPNLSLICMSGVPPEHVPAQPHCEFLAKPIRIGQLGAALEAG